MDKKKTRLKGYFYLFLWAILIAAGIIEKRVYDNPDVMVFYHFPAAVFLVMGWYTLSAKNRKRYQEQLKIWQRRSEGA